MSLSLNNMPNYGLIISSVDEEYSSVLEECFGNWISGLWFKYPRLTTFDEHKEAFLVLLKRLLDEGKVVALPPWKFLTEESLYTVPTRKMPIYLLPEVIAEKGSMYLDVWDISTDEILTYFRKTFPKDVTDADDRALTDFWYSTDCPRIGWYDEETDSIVAS